MGVASNLIIIFSIIGIGFGAGLHLNLIDDNATMYRIQNLIPKTLSYSDGLPFFNLAFMSGEGNGLISHATVAFGLGSIVIDPNEIPNDGDEYFENRITQCEFHSEEDIDEPICIVCRILDTHEKEECVDQWLGFTEFEHGTLLSNDDGFPNAVIPGVTITAVASTHSGGGKNAVMIFDGDTLGGFGEGTTPDPDLRADADCPDCAGLHIAVIAENTAGGADGIVDSPDDNAIGGLQTWVFDQAWFVPTFDFVDYDKNDVDGEARAYDNPECDGTPVATAVISKNPNGGDGSVQTITLNANNVRCLVFDYPDSGGITNIHLKCIKKLNLDDVIAVGLADLPDGYTASTVVPIPLLHGGVDVFEAQSVQIKIGKSLIDFAGLSHGDSFATVKGYLLSNFGITLEIDGDNGIDEAIIYNSFNVGGADTDLEHPLIPDDQSIGNLLIMKEDSGNQPNDSGAGGIIRFKSVDSMTYVSIDVVDHDNNGATSEIRSYRNFDCTDIIDTSDIVADGNNNVKTVQINDANVKCLEIFYKDSGGFTNLLLGCLGAFHEIAEGCTPGFWKQSQHFDSWTGFLTTQLVGSVFNQATPATSGSTLLEALSFMGGDDLEGAEKILLRAAVAAILSASSPDVIYPSTVTEIITSVNNAIVTGDRDTMISLASQIDADNNRGCPMNGGNPKEKFFMDGFEDESTISGVWYMDNDRTTTPHPNKIWFGQASRGEIGAHSGQFYLGGSGNIDDRDDTDDDGVTNPAWAAKNRYIDISQYTDIWLSFWYSFDNTESSDEFAMYYRVDGGAWQEIFLIDPETQSNQQVPWQFVEIGVPDGNGVEIQFRWETSAGSSDDIVMIDDLELWGVLK